MFRAADHGQRLEFDTGGVRGGNELFRDRATGSVWQQSTAQAISGPLTGHTLALEPFLLTTWAEWQRLHPATQVLQPLPGYAARLERMNRVLAAGIRPDTAAPGALRQDPRLQPHAMVLGLEAGGAAMAFPVATLAKRALINTVIGGVPVVIVHQANNDTTTAYERKWKGKSVTLQARGGELEDAATHSRWNAYGHCVAGPLRGAQLPALNLEPEFWFAWSEFHPQTGVLQP